MLISPNRPLASLLRPSAVLSRIFLALAVFAVLLLAANLLVGITLGDFGQASRAYQRAYHQHETLTDATRHELRQAEDAREAAMLALRGQRGGFWLHIWLGITAILVTLLVNSISVTYFIGTNRWSQEVVTAFGLPDVLAKRSQALKRQAFPWSFLGIVLVLAIAAFGAAADPATFNPDAADWVPYHWILAMAGVVLIAMSFYFQVIKIGENFELINEIMAAAEGERERRRQARQQLEGGPSPQAATCATIPSDEVEFSGGQP